MTCCARARACVPLPEPVPVPVPGSRFLFLFQRPTVEVGFAFGVFGSRKRVDTYEKRWLAQKVAYNCINMQISESKGGRERGGEAGRRRDWWAALTHCRPQCQRVSPDRQTGHPPPTPLLEHALLATHSLHPTTRNHTPVARYLRMCEALEQKSTAYFAAATKCTCLNACVQTRLEK